MKVRSPLRILLDTEGAPDVDDETVFWLVVADQFRQRGVACPEAQARAQAVLDSEADLQRCARLGMSETNLVKRRQVLEKLGQELLQVVPKKRTALSKPQKLLFQAGEVVAYPTCKGSSTNPYLGDRHKNRGWVQDGWGAMVIVEAEQLFGYLAWYRPAVAQIVWSEPASLAQVAAVTNWRLGHAATCSSQHYKRMEVQSVGQLQLNPDWSKHLNSDFVSGKEAALGDVSICNRMQIEPTSRFGALDRSELLAL